MNINHKQAFLAMFDLLDEYYDMTKNDDLGAILGSISPKLFVDGEPADPASWHDWEDSIHKVTTKELINCMEALQAVREFLNLYQVEFGYNLVWLLEEWESANLANRWAARVSALCV